MLFAAYCCTLWGMHGEKNNLISLGCLSRLICLTGRGYECAIV